MKTLTEQFFDYVASVYPEPVEPDQYNEMEKAFMAGVAVTVATLDEASSLTNQESGTKMLMDLRGQMHDFFSQFDTSKLDKWKETRRR